jgi:hypothetical protein
MPDVKRNICGLNLSLHVAKGTDEIHEDLMQESQSNFSPKFGYSISETIYSEWYTKFKI